MQLNNPSVMKNSTGAGLLSNTAHNIASAKDDNIKRIGSDALSSSQILLRDAAKQ